MTESIDEVLDRAEDALRLGRGLEGTGFWAAVRQVKKDPALVERYADRIARIDRRAFERGVVLRIPAVVGVTLLAGKTAFGIGAVTIARHFGAPPQPVTILDNPRLFERFAFNVPGFVPMCFILGFAALLLGTHSLTHWIVGRSVGMRFTHVFLGGPPPPRPGVKTDYATYLRTSPMQRAVMHASGAVVTKVVPFALIPFAPDYQQWPWVTWLLIAVGVLQIVTDVFLSTKVSDWKKVKRELRDR